MLAGLAVAGATADPHGFYQAADFFVLPTRHDPCSLVVLEALWLRTGKPIYMQIAQHWAKIFAVSFGMGVVSGIVMPFQFGTNWPGFIERAGNISGPLLGYEVLTAFFLEEFCILLLPAHPGAPS